MIGQYLLNNNETATVGFRQKFYQLNNPLIKITEIQTQGHSRNFGPVWIQGLELV
jgi:hypothetical protein